MVESTPVLVICTRECSTVLEARKSEVKCRTQINPWERVLRNGVESVGNPSPKLGPIRQDHNP